MRNLIVASRGRNPANPNDRTTSGKGTFVQRMETIGHYTATLTSIAKDNYVLEIYEQT